MKNTCKSVRVLVAALITFGSLSVQSHAAITISNFQISSSVVSFDVSGELSGPTPADDLAAIFFVNSNATLDPGFVVPSGFTAPLIHTWTGSQALNGAFPLFTGSQTSFNTDYFGLFFASNLSEGETISGSVTATFSPGTFDVTQVSQIDVVWGRDAALPTVSGGAFQGIIAVPEPSSLLLIGLGAAGFVTRRKRIS
jgi:hypothetical protein